MAHDHGAVLQFEVNLELDLLTLASKTAIKTASIIDGARLQGFHLIWAKIARYLSGKTSTEGPIQFGMLANLSIGNLKAILEDDIQSRQGVTKTGPGSWYQPITLFGVDETEGDINGTQGATNVQAQSRFTKYPVKWTIPEGDNFGFYAFNHDGSALTTGAKIILSAQYFGA